MHHPFDQSITGLERQATAIWAAVKRACLLEDFRPKPGPLCDWCGYHAYCPAKGGDLALVSGPVAGRPAGGRYGVGIADCYRSRWHRSKCSRSRRRGEPAATERPPLVNGLAPRPELAP